MVRFRGFMEKVPVIIFEDSDILVVNKPAGLTVNRAETTKGVMTVQDWVEQKVGKKEMNVDLEPVESGEYSSEFYTRGGIVHRLDKETSGTLIIAKTQKAFDELQRQFRERIVKKTYTALAHGHIRPEKGIVRIPVGRLEFNRHRFGVVAGGRDSVTEYMVTGLYSSYDRKSKELFSLIELYPQTGRTHQIRVHLKYLNHPIVSDELYAGRKTARDDRKYLPRLFLHAAGIQFIHPGSRKEMEFKSPLSQELEGFLLSLTQIKGF